MNKQMHEVMQRRGELLASIAAQREQVAQIGTRWRSPTGIGGSRISRRAFSAFQACAGRQRGRAICDSPARRSWFDEERMADVERIPLPHRAFGKIIVTKLGSGMSAVYNNAYAF